MVVADEGVGGGFFLAVWVGESVYDVVVCVDELYGVAGGGVFGEIKIQWKVGVVSVGLDDAGEGVKFVFVFELATVEKDLLGGIVMEFDELFGFAGVIIAQDFRKFEAFALAGF